MANASNTLSTNANSGVALNTAAPANNGLNGGKQKEPELSQRESNYLTRGLGLATVIALLLTGLLTFFILFGLTPLEPNENVVKAALFANTLLALILVALIVMEVLRLLRSRRKGRAAARLHIRIVGLFALVAALPAILVAIVASVTLDLGLDRWFEIRTKEIVQGSVSVAQAYVDESARVHVNATVSMASELDRARRLYSLDRAGFVELMNLQTRGRGMIAAELVRENGDIVISSKTNEEITLPSVPKESLEAAKTGDVIFIPRGRTNIIGSVLKMRAIPDAYLYTIRPMREDVLLSLRQMEENTNEYTALENSRLPVQLTFAVLYLSMALMILLAAIWMGISVADRFVRPIRRLINAADEVSSGNLDVNVDTQHTEGDFKNLGDTFNIMTTQLKQQRSELLRATKDIDDRARFTEAVLSGVSAAVIGVDETGHVKIANLTTKTLFGKEIGPEGNIASIQPELATVLENARKSGKAEYREQISAMIDGQSRSLNVQVTQERDATSENSFVITIDDITDLVVAQRSTAWSDIARRIAHEIKNPLTPIQLSAERIRKRYRKYITEDTEVFDRCTDTIIRQVGDIGRMVDEFSSFARMPKPEMSKGDISKTIQEALFTQKVANSHINYALELGEGEHIVRYDDRLMSQALINLIKNAGEAIDAVPDDELPPGQGKVLIRTSQNKECVVIDIIDNGKGLPEDDRQKLLEPYMTTRQKGTGLGLAIVRKILEDHGGTIELMDAPDVASGGRGAMMRLRIPLHQAIDHSSNDLSGTGENVSKSNSDRMGDATSLSSLETDNKRKKEATS